MKTLNRKAATILAAVILASVTATGTSYRVGVSPNHVGADREGIFKTLVLFALADAAAGDKIVVYDALNLQLVTQFQIPEGKLFQGNARARAQRLQAEIASLRQFFSAERAHPAELTGVIHVPEFLDLVGTQLRGPDEPLKVILVGSPFYMNSGEPAFNMDDVYPSDAHLTAEQRESVFGTARKKRTLNGVTVHYAYLHPCFQNDFHQERITRFWSLFVRQQQGVLATFAPDISLALQRARENIQQPCVDAQLDPNDTKIEMRQVVRRAIPVWFGPTNIIQRVVQTVEVPRIALNAGKSTNWVIPGDQPAAEPLSAPPSIAQTPPASTALQVTLPSLQSFPIRPTSNQVGIGIMWSAPVDCDLYVRANPSAQELYYRATKTKEGRYFHDYRNANIGLDYEYVELTPPVDITKISAWVNYFAGKTSPVNGMFILYYEGKSYSGEFELSAPMGNRGWEGSNRGKSKYWTQLDLVKLVTNASEVRPVAH
jgi:hypothetical protein